MYSSSAYNFKLNTQKPRTSAPKTRHQRWNVRFRIEKVRFAPNSGRNWVWRGMSAFDPKRTLRVMLDVGESKRQPRTNWFVSPRCGSVLFRKISS